MLIANKCDAPIRRAEPVCQSENNCDTERQQQLCDAANMRHQHQLNPHQEQQKKHHEQNHHSHMTPLPPPRRTTPPDERLAHAQAQAAAASTHPMRADKAPPLPFMDEMDDDESMAQFRRRFDGSEFFLRQPSSDRAAQLSRSA